DDVGSPGPAAEEAVQLGEHGSFESHVAGFAAAAGEDDFLWRRTEQAGDLTACLVHGVVRGLAVRVGTGGVAKVLAQVDLHGLDHGGVERRGGVVIEVDRTHVRLANEKGAVAGSPRPQRLRLTRRGSYRRRSPNTRKRG